MDLSLHVIPVSQRIFKVQTERKPPFRKLPEQIYKGKIPAYCGNNRHLTTCPWSLLPQPQQTSVINHFFPSFLLNLHRASWQYDNQISIIRCQETYLPPLFIFPSSLPSPWKSIMIEWKELRLWTQINLGGNLVSASYYFGQMNKPI